ncbi:hypothetical protein CCACVL1_20499 [Corchorus capsularis]|uniref:Uncharacterized protein n=1 Tax=Corchorus capsularis TaxID=210143 RepID=A0A1R3HAT8_COCAP|nr:hypothetical protein CCACVL1_20499 [Corchorus capsularis]
MDKLGFFTISLLVVFQLTSSADSPVPAPAPSLGADSSPQLAPPPETGSPHSAPTISPVTSASPPAPVAPSPSDLEGGKSPASSPAPSPDASDINHSNINADGSEEYVGGGGGMSGGKKAGIVVAVLVAVCLVGLGGLVYKKRQDNIRRTQYGYAARREIL